MVYISVAIVEMLRNVNVLFHALEAVFSGVVFIFEYSIEAPCIFIKYRITDM